MKEKLAAMQKELAEARVLTEARVPDGSSAPLLERRVVALERQLWELFNDLGVFVAYVEEKLGQIPEND